MGLLDSIFNNEKVLNTALGSVKKMMLDNGIKYVVIQLDENGNIAPEMYKDADQPVIMSSAKMEQLRSMMLEQEQTILQHQVELRRLRVETVSAIPVEPAPGDGRDEVHDDYIDNLTTKANGNDTDSQ
jgi:hypothetical protein